jgi:hypothetical protein
VLNGRGANEADFGIVVFVVRLLEVGLDESRWSVSALFCVYGRRLALLRRVSTASARAVSVAATSPAALEAAPSTASPSKVLMAIFFTVCTSAAPTPSSPSPLRACRNLRGFWGACRGHRGVLLRV